MAAIILIGSLVAAYWLRYGLLPLRPQNGRLPGPDPQLQPVLKAVRTGEWEPAALLVGSAGSDWNLRAHYVQHLAYTAVYDDDAWLGKWHAARPEDPDAMLVSACARVEYAWKLRGAAYASATSTEQFQGFHRELVGAQQDLAHIAALNPDDPTPLAKEIWVALGLGYSKEQMRSLWTEVTKRAPDHYQAHSAALQYKCRKWRGSAQEAEQFAAEAARRAPRGSLLTVLPLVSWYEHHVLSAEGRVPADFFRTPVLTALVDAALDDVAAAEGHPNLPSARHALAYFLLRQGRYRAAVEQFRHVDGYAEAFPWRYRPWKKLSYRAHRTRAMWGALLTRG
ncbi:hypothetical protein [Streptomyces sp. NBC_01233]|uniref:hypothetical protein n=1 Tax=Streptomyces sp. NBC_01233 TaxID=2903787 RepID=UPI002E103A3A|nr:hypothetical protein OG332_21120 [Streptomyces sp. NBC_01233]